MLCSRETGIIFVSAIVRSANDFVITIASVYRSSVEDTVTNSRCSIPIYYVVTITGINGAYVVNAITKKGVFSWSVADAGDYVVTIGGIKCARVENAIFAPNTRNPVVTSKSISDASIDESFLHSRQGDNIILVSKR